MGTIINGWLITAFGPKKVVLCTLCVMSCFLFIVFFAPNKPVLLAGEILLGFGELSCAFILPVSFS
jgi:SP family general alpha glucoside:H+ symporter-like MFS transporter